MTARRPQRVVLGPRVYKEPEEPKAIIRQKRLDDLPLLDLTPISRPGMATTISVADDSGMRPWIKLRETALSQYNGGSRRGSWRFTAYWANGATDQEHDSAYIMQMDLGGVELDMIHYGRISITGWIAGQSDAFRIPPADYGKLLRTHPEIAICKECRKRDKTQKDHLLLPSGFYVPPEQPELYAQMIGRQIEITMDHRKYAEED